MIDGPKRQKNVALNLAGWVQGGLSLDYLADAPAWWVDGIRERLQELDAIKAEAMAVIDARPAVPVMDR